MAKMTKITSLGIVKVGDVFIAKPNIVGFNFPFEGKTLIVAGFMPANYVNRVMLRDSKGSELLLPLSTVEKYLSV